MVCQHSTISQCQKTLHLLTCCICCFLEDCQGILFYIGVSVLNNGMEIKSLLAQNMQECRMDSTPDSGPLILLISDSCPE